jgi:hypothetical protein
LILKCYFRLSERAQTMKNGPLNEGGPEDVQRKSDQEESCAKSSPPASTKSPRHLPPEILSAIARSGRRPITLPRVATPSAPDDDGAAP